MPDVQDRVWIAGVCDPYPRRAKAAAEKYNVNNYYETCKELLDNANVDAVTICSPINFHYEQGMAAIEKGKHIHFNKTMATTVEEADNLISYAKKRNIYIVPSPGQMLYPHNKRIRKYVLEETLGKITWSIAGYAIGNYHLEEECTKQAIHKGIHAFCMHVDFLASSFQAINGFTDLLQLPKSKIHPIKSQNHTFDFSVRARLFYSVNQGFERYHLSGCQIKWINNGGFAQHTT